MKLKTAMAALTCKESLTICRYLLRVWVSQIYCAILYVNVYKPFLLTRTSSTVNTFNGTVAIEKEASGLHRG